MVAAGCRPSPRVLLQQFLQRKFALLETMASMPGVFGPGLAATDCGERDNMYMYVYMGIP